MLKYIVKKLIIGVLTLFLVATLIFFLLRLLPKDYYFSEEEMVKLTEQQRYAVLTAVGLNDPISNQLMRFYGDIIHLDFGVSNKIQKGVSVSYLISDRMKISLKLGIISLVISVVLGVFVGVIQTLNKDRFGDKLGSAFVILSNAVPTIVSFTLIMMFGTLVLKLPSMYSMRAHPVSSVIMPVICLSLTSVAGYALWTRRYMVDELNKDYIALARMKGLSNFRIMFKHVFRNAIVPLVQFLPSSFLYTIGGSLLVEKFFSVPGMGPLLTDAIQRYDINVVQALVIIYAALGIVGVLLGDILMCIVDPRITFSKKEGIR